MKQLIFVFLIVGYLLWPSCQHADINTPTEPDPIDSSHTKTCEDTIEINYSGEMAQGYLKGIKTCRDWTASGRSFAPVTKPNHIIISGDTYFPHILTNGDTVFLYAENLSFRIPKQAGKFPIISPVGYLPDTATCIFSYLEVDISLADWLVDDSFPGNEVEITTLDLTNKRVKGRFNVHLKIDPSMAGFEHYPSKLYFHEGEFDVEIIE